jgi:predicted alternative tryptophan synthase beta-subunit
MRMVRSWFSNLPEAFNTSLVPHSMPKEKKGFLASFLEKKIFKVKRCSCRFISLPENALFLYVQVFFLLKTVFSS